VECHVHKKFRAITCNAKDAESHPAAIKARAALLQEFGKTSLSGIYTKDPTARGPFGSAEIWLKEGAVPVDQHPYRIGGERGEAWGELVDKAGKDNRLEPYTGAWNLPTFTVAKKTPGKYRLVQNFRRLNDATIKNGHPLLRIVDMLYTQGKSKLWSKLDLVNGFHKMHMKPEQRPITCMSTLRGTIQWNVLVHCMKNASAQFHRIMEWVLRDIHNAHPYMDDIIFGSDRETVEDLIENHTKDIRRVLKTLEDNQLVASLAKSAFFQRKVESLGLVIREGVRKPSSGKLLHLQKWEIPRTITELRGFLGLTNYFSEYVKDSSEFAAQLMAKLQVGREDGK